MRQTLLFWSFIIILLVNSACQNSSNDTQTKLPDSEPINSGVDSRTEQDVIKTEAGVSPIETIIVTPKASPTIKTGEEPMSESKANANVEFVKAVQSADESWTFHVTVRHPDTGQEDYADGWDVVTPDGTVLKVNESDPFTRLLLHPHENEQPFTRSQRGIVIPEDVTQVSVRAHDLVDGFGGREVIVDLMVQEGPDFEVQWLAN